MKRRAVNKERQSSVAHSPTVALENWKSMWVDLVWSLRSAMPGLCICVSCRGLEVSDGFPFCGSNRLVYPYLVL